MLLLCATLYGRRLGAWHAAVALINGFLAIATSANSTRMEPLARIEAWRLLARCHTELGEAAKAHAALEAAVGEARDVGYVFMEQLAQSELRGLAQ